jgi:hypothetical protein
MNLTVETQQTPPFNTIVTLIISSRDINRFYLARNMLPPYLGTGPISVHLRYLADFAKALEEGIWSPEDEQEERADEPAPPDACERCGSVGVELGLDFKPIEIHGMLDSGVYESEPRWLCDFCQHDLDKELAYFANTISRILEGERNATER